MEKGYKDLLCSLLMLSFVEENNGLFPLGAVSPLSSPDKEREREMTRKSFLHTSPNKHTSNDAQFLTHAIDDKSLVDHS